MCQCCIACWYVPLFYYLQIWQSVVLFVVMCYYCIVCCYALLLYCLLIFAIIVLFVVPLLYCLFLCATDVLFVKTCHKYTVCWYLPLLYCWNIVCYKSFLSFPVLKDILIVVPGRLQVLCLSVRGQLTAGISLIRPKTNRVYH